jgi:membrane protease YdiL (CAAX protease family)
MTVPALAVPTLLMAVEVLGFTLVLGVFSPPFWSFLGGGFVGMLGSWLLYGLAAVVLGAALNRVQRRGGLGALGFRYHRGFWADAGAGVVAYAVIYLASLPVEVTALSARATSSAALVKQLGLTSAAQVVGVGSVLALVLGFVTGAFHEEVRFRGYYQGTGSREATPMVGFVMALIPFTLGHHFSHPDWTLVQVLATFIPGVGYGLLYHATGSLVAVMTAHALGNWMPAYPVLVLVGTSSRAAALATAAGLGVAFAVLIYLRRSTEVRVFLESTRAMVRERPVFGFVAGALAGAALLATWPLRSSSPYAGWAGVILIAVAVVGKRYRTPTPAGGERGSMTDGA